MRSLKKWLVLMTLAGLPGALAVRAADEQPMTLDRCIQLVVEHNPLVLSSLEKYNAAKARVNEARAIPQPSLTLDSDFEPRLFNFNDAGETHWGFTETLEFPGRRSVRGRIASREADQTMSDVELLKLDLIYQVKEAFYGVLLADETIACARQDLDLSKDFLDKAEIMRKAGDIAEVEVMRARVEYAKTVNAMASAENDKKLAAARLNYLLARRPYDPLEVKGALKGPVIDLDIEALKNQALISRPEIKSMEFARQAESLRKTQASMSYLPDFDLGFMRHKVLDSTTTWEFTLSMSVPLFFWQPKKGQIAEAQANLRSIEHEAEDLRNSVALDVEQAALNAVTARDQMKLFDQNILAQAEEVYSIFLFKFQKGEIGGMELIEARRSLNESRRSYAEALFNYRMAIAALEKSVGHSLEGGSYESTSQSD